MNRGPREAPSHAVDTLAAPGAVCGECGAMRGHYIGCSILPPPVMAELCPECSRTPPYHTLACSRGTAAGLISPAAASPSGAAVPSTAAPDATAPEEEASASATVPAPALHPSSGAAAHIAPARQALAAAGPRPVRLLPDPPDVSDHFPGDVKVGSRYRCAECGEFIPCSALLAAEAWPTPDQVRALEMVDVGWSIEQRTADPLRPRVVKGIVIGFEDDDERGRIFTIIRFRQGTPWFDPIPAIEVEPNFIGPPNVAFSRSTYRDLAAWVGKRTGTADEREVRALTNALVLAQTVI